jgi:hypothetical protein
MFECVTEGAIDREKDDGTIGARQSLPQPFQGSKGAAFDINRVVRETTNGVKPIGRRAHGSARLMPRSKNASPD